jgi:putative glutathione S-transferase
MGMLIDGRWVPGEGFSSRPGGAFVRANSVYRDRIAAGGPFPPEAGRYHLYVSLACPWAHRTLIARRLKGLEPLIPVSVVSPLMGPDGWHFGGFPAATEDRVAGLRTLADVYAAADPGCSTRVTVPLLLDTRTGRLVNNESSELLRIFDRAFDEVGADPSVQLAPEALLPELDAVNERVYQDVNNGVYRCGFARTQEAYDEAVAALFAALDWLEERLATRRYLVGGRLTEADIRLYTTLVRFDPVYVGHFKCNLRRIADYPHLSAYLRDLYAIPAFRETTDLDHIRHHYHRSHPSLNPSGIVPAGPILDLDAPHGRDAVGEPDPILR